MTGTYLGDHRVLIEAKWGGLLIVPSTDLSIAPFLIARGIFEAPLTKYMLKTLKAGDVVLDVGANFGYYTVLMGLLVGDKGKLVAYEANPAMYAFLRDNISVNYLKNQCEARSVAVYSRVTTTPFFVTERFPCNSSIHPRSDDYLRDHVDTIRTIEVPTEPLDTLRGRFKRIRLIKMDIEGGEYEAFLGMAGLFEDGVIETISFEWNAEMLKDKARPFFDLILDQARRYGMRLFGLSNEGDCLPIEPQMLLDHVFMPYVILQKG